LKILDHDESKLELLNKFKIDDGTVLLTSLKLLSNDDNKVKLVKKYVGTITVNQCVTALNQIMLPDKKGLAATYLLQRVVNNDNSLQSLDNFSDIFVSYEYFERLSSDIGFSTENIQIVKARFEETVILENPKGSYNLNIQCAGDTLIVDGSNYPMPIGARYRIGDTLIVRKGDGRHFIIKYPSKN
jgi:hypothetical protein